MKIRHFLNGMSTLGIDFFTGVPDSLLKPLNDALYAAYGCRGKHVVAANEGGAVALAAGHYIATGKPALCYLQNSGIGNAVNPVTSLLDTRVYGIPCVFVVGWRGEPGIQDEPQHAFQGLITREMLALLDLTIFEISPDTSAADFEGMLAQCAPLLKAGQSVVWLVHQGAFVGEEKISFPSAWHLTREEALRELLSASTDSDIFVSTTGKTSREVFELRNALHQDHAHDFLTVGSMGHANMIALGIAKAKPERTVWCLNGDGAALMHMGGLVVEVKERATNLIHVLLNNAAHESVGGMPVATGNLRFAPLARAAGYECCFTAESAADIQSQLAEVREAAKNRLVFWEILLSQGSRTDLGRPTQTPQENLHGLMAQLKAPLSNDDAN